MDIAGGRAGVDRWRHGLPLQRWARINTVAGAGRRTGRGACWCDSSPLCARGPFTLRACGQVRALCRQLQRQRHSACSWDDERCSTIGGALASRRASRRAAHTVLAASRSASSRWSSCMRFSWFDDSLVIRCFASAARTSGRIRLRFRRGRIRSVAMFFLGRGCARFYHINMWKPTGRREMNGWPGRSRDSRVDRRLDHLRGRA